ncbi:hypothetical protein K438DRAFT_1997469 [Mycena galopus ATCC 62051]|nr:hypothetical protein K438DRAFT_1997469 [Mycena galopus ATCC 62051]
MTSVRGTSILAKAPRTSIFINAPPSKPSFDMLDAEEKAHRHAGRPRTGNTTHVEKRDTEILYLANCLPAVSCCTPEKDWSKMIYYSNSADSDNPQSVQRPLSGPGSGYTTWEGNQKSCTFSTGVTFEEAINSNAQSLADYLYSGIV